MFNADLAFLFVFLLFAFFFFIVTNSSHAIAAKTPLLSNQSGPQFDFRIGWQTVVGCVFEFAVLDQAARFLILANQSHARPP